MVYGTFSVHTPGYNTVRNDREEIREIWKGGYAGIGIKIFKECKGRKNVRSNARGYDRCPA